MKFRNVTKLQLAFANYEAMLEDIDRVLFGMPHANHESAERSDALAARQYALKTMDVIDKQNKKFLEQQQRKEYIHNSTCRRAIEHIDYILNKYDLPKEIKQLLGLKEQLTAILAYVLEKEDLEKTISFLECVDKF